MEKCQAGKAAGKKKRTMQQNAWPSAPGFTGVLAIITNTQHESFGEHRGYFCAQKEWEMGQWKLDENSDFIRLGAL